MVLTGNNFILRRWEVGDAQSLQKNANDERISSMLLDRFPAPYTLKDAEAFINLKMPEEPVTNFA